MTLLQSIPVRGGPPVSAAHGVPVHVGLYFLTVCVLCAGYVWLRVKLYDSNRFRSRRKKKN